MATRKPTSEQNAALDPALPQKKRARRRVAGALALCMAAAIVLPLVLDSEPRQVRDDVQVQIPSRDSPVTDPLPRGAGVETAPNSAAPMTGDPQAPGDDAAATAESSRASEGGGVAATASPSSVAPLAGAAVAGAAGAIAVAGKGDAASSGKNDAAATKGDAVAAKGDAVAAKSDAVAAKSDAVPTKGDAAAAKTDSKSSPKADPKAGAKSAGGFLLQIGAFASEKGATEQAQRARKAGLKAFTEKVQTPRGERIRVRAGPFTTREAADQARAKLKAHGVESTLIAP